MDLHNKSLQRFCDIWRDGGFLGFEEIQNKYGLTQEEESSIRQVVSTVEPASLWPCHTIGSWRVIWPVPTKEAQHPTVVWQSCREFLANIGEAEYWIPSQVRMYNVNNQTKRLMELSRSDRVFHLSCGLARGTRIHRRIPKWL